MTLPEPIQWYNSQADRTFPDSPFNRICCENPFFLAAWVSSWEHSWSSPSCLLEPRKSAGKLINKMYLSFLLKKRIFCWIKAKKHFSMHRSSMRSIGSGSRYFLSSYLAPTPSLPQQKSMGLFQFLPYRGQMGSNGVKASIRWVNQCVARHKKNLKADILILL